tara:strand:+ start:5510 stop:8254 length:2745 start_codon:yes stop_codon:yes gene_type:complete
MAAVSQSIPNLLGGVSQQPDPIKLPGQVREAVNAYLDPTFGCKKRPPTEFVGLLANNIPSDAKWFPIFRDNDERYIIAIYKSGSPATIQVKAWDANTGQTRTVTVSSSAQTYLDTTNLNNLKTLSIADYTLISNADRDVSMNAVQLTTTKEEALVVINSIAYNTTYSIDLNRDGNTQQTKVYRAAELEIIPGSYEIADNGACSQHSAGDHTGSATGKSGLQFRITNQCSAYYDEESNSYISRYNASVILKNGGVGWRVGDTVTATQGGKQFTIRVSKEAFEYTYASDGIATFTTPSNASSGTLQIGDIITNLKNAVNNISNYTCDSIGNVLRIKRSDTRSFNIAVRGGTTNQAMTVIKDTANDIAELPFQCFPNFICKVKNTQDSTADDYYVIFEPDAAGIPGAGSWTETIKPGIETGLNSSTMPHALIRQANGTFTLDALNSSSAFGGWASKEVGDEFSNPNPSFVDKGISNMFFFANRLGFLCEDAVILSQPGDYFNFFQTSAITVTDSDPIDLTASSTKPAILQAAIGTPKGLILFAENSQFLMASQEVAFGPATVKLTEIATYTYKSITEPLSTGVSVMFVTEADTYTKILEMAADSVDNRPTVSDNTRIIPEYIPPDLKWATNSPNNSMLFWGDNTNTVFSFKFFNAGNERQLAGWSKWTFPTQVRMMEFDNDTAYIVSYDGTNSTLQKMELLDDPDTAPISTSFNTKFLPRLDFIHPKASLTTSTVGSNTKIYFPTGGYVNGTTPVFIMTSGADAGYFIRPTIQTDGGGKFILVPSSLTSVNYVIGMQYRMTVSLPAFYVATEGKADRIDNPVVELLYLDLYYSGRYEVEIEKLGYTNYTHNVDIARAGLYLANAPALEEVVTKTVPIFCLGRDAKASIYADDPVPSAITSYSWQGHYNKRDVLQLKG